MKLNCLKILFIVICTLSGNLFFNNNPAVASDSGEKYPLLLRVDDIGMNHATNTALKALAETGIPLSASVMFTCAWYEEAVEILEENPHIAVGVHLTLNSEWKYYKWGPVLGPEAVPTLVNKEGHFYPSTTEFLEQEYNLDEVRRELEAQINRAINTGLDIDYIDFHMRTAVATPELEQIVFDLAEEYDLRMSMYMDEAYKTLFDTPIDEKKSDFLDHIQNNLIVDKVNLVVIHAAFSHPEMEVLIDLNNPVMNTEDGRPLTATHRQQELDVLLSTEVQALLKSGKFQLVNYRM